MPDREQQIQAVADSLMVDMPGDFGKPYRVRAAMRMIAAYEDLAALEPSTQEPSSFARSSVLDKVREAIREPEIFCAQLRSYPPPLRQMEPMDRWQARAVLAALERSEA